MAALRVFLKRFLYHSCFCRVWLNRPCFGIVHIAKRRKAWPFSAPEFLADTALYIFRKIIGIVFALTERHLQHELPLRSGLKPECRKAQRSDFALVYEVDN